MRQLTVWTTKRSAAQMPRSWWLRKVRQRWWSLGRTRRRRADGRAETLWAAVVALGFKRQDGAEGRQKSGRPSRRSSVDMVQGT